MQVDNRNIYYTDDDEDDQELFRGALAEIDDSLVLTTANDGDMLLELLEQLPIPRVIFLDLNMPRKNGYEVLSEMRSDEKLKDYPVVIFSTTSDDSAVDRTRKLGANLFIPKPRSFKGIKEAIQTCVNIDWTQFAAARENFILRIG